MRAKTTNGRIRLRAVPVHTPAPESEKRPAANPAPELTIDGPTAAAVLSVQAEQVRPPYKLTGTARVRKTEEIAVRGPRRDTGLSMGEIASALILQAAAVCTIRRAVGPMG